jgi:hypothetical protein
VASYVARTTGHQYSIGHKLLSLGCCTNNFIKRIIVRPYRE